MATWLVLLACLVLCSGQLSKKHNRLLELSKNGTKAMSWTTGKYRKFLKTTTERPYAVITLFNAKDERYGCQICKPMEELFFTAATSYGQAKASFPGTVPDLFFASVDIKDAHVIFQENQVNTVPFLVYFPADESNPTAKVLEQESSIGSLRQMLHYISVQHHISVPKPVDATRTAVLVTIVALVVAILATFATFYPETVLKFPWSRTIWMCGSFLIYFTGISGMIFCIIRSPPTFVYQNPKQFQFIHTNGRQQFVYEGLLIGGIQLGAAVALILMIRSAKTTTRVSDRFQNLLVSIFTLAIFIYLWSALIGLYSRKNQWYTATQVIPSIKWIRKLIKLGNYWVYHYTTLAAFFKKAQALLK